MQVCIKKRRFIRLFFGGEWEGAGGLARVGGERARREGDEARESRPPNPLAIRTNGTVVSPVFPPSPIPLHFLSLEEESGTDEEKEEGRHGR